MVAVTKESLDYGSAKSRQSFETGRLPMSRSWLIGAAEVAAPSLSMPDDARIV